MPVRTKRWNDPIEADDGFRLLICRYRPRGVPKSKEPWDASCPALAPSAELHAAFYGKQPGAAPISFEEYRERFLSEMRQAQFWITRFAEHVQSGQMLTLLCSAACTDVARCHRSLVKELIESSLQTAEKAVRRPRAP
jgi:uncharacterized protein YeaO (DUF488 family)